MGKAIRESYISIRLGKSSKLGMLIRQSRGEQRLRTSTLAWDRPEKGEEQEILQGKSDESHSPTPLQEDSTRDDEDFWTITGDLIYRHHLEPLYVPKEETFPISMKYNDVTRTTHTSPDVMLEKNIEDYWNVGEKNCKMHGQDSQDSFY